MEKNCVGKYDKAMSKKLEILSRSLEKKQRELQRLIDAHIQDVRHANGQPLNDKRNGAATMRRWERQDAAITSMMASIERTKAAIAREEGMNRYNEGLPEVIRELLQTGELKQWRKYPHIFFVAGVEGARIVWDARRRTVNYKYDYKVTDTEQWRRFCEVYRMVSNEINGLI